MAKLSRNIKTRFQASGPNIIHKKIDALTSQIQRSNDDLRRRDGLDLELTFLDIAKNQTDILKLIQELSDRIDETERALSTGRMVALVAGSLTAGGLSTSFNIDRSFGVTIATLTTTGITFVFDRPRPTAKYAVTWSNLSGNTTAANHAVNNETITGFDLITFSGTVSANPRIVNIQFICAVYDRDEV